MRIKDPFNGILLIMFKNFFRKRRLRKDGSTIPSGFIPLDEIHSVAVIIDASEPGYDTCLGCIRNYCSRHRMSLSVLFMDFRKFSSKVRMTTDRASTVTRRDLNWFGRPDLRKAYIVTGKPVDLFICLANDSSYCTEYLSKAAKARFKIGRNTFEGDPFNLIVAEPENGIQQGQESPDGTTEIPVPASAGTGKRNVLKDARPVPEKIFLAAADLIEKIEHA